MSKSFRPVMILFTIWYAVLLGSGCGSQAASTPAKVATVFGADKRQVIYSSDYPYRAIGRIELQTNFADVRPFTRARVPFCTASLVAADVIVTNAHCVLEGSQVTRRGMTFYPAYGKHLAIGKSQGTVVAIGTKLPLRFPGKDWALIKLETRIGDNIGWFQVQVIANPVGQWFRHAGYATAPIINFRTGILPVDGQWLSLDPACRIRGVRRGSWLNDCASSNGSSGGPIFLDPKSVDEKANTAIIAAINAQQYLDDFGQPLPLGVAYAHQLANTAVPVSAFFDKLQSLSH